MTIVDALEPVSLDELNSAAALLTRTDRKYVVPASALDSVVAAEPTAPRVLQIDDIRSFRYASTYFDTADLTSYDGVAFGRRRRFKVRTRQYVDTGGCWLEAKTKGVRGLTVKRRTSYPLADRDLLTPAAHEWISAELSRAGVVGVEPADLSPTLHTTYRRTTLLLADGTSRVTVDAGLTWHAAHATVAAGDVLVIETKSAAGSSSTVDRALWARGHRPVRLSKYGTGMHLVDDSLTGNKWRPVITRHLRAAVTAQGPRSKLG